MTDQTQTAGARMPLFYQKPRVLIADAHRDLHLTAAHDFAFARATNAVPIMVPEFVEAQHSYPIVFVGEPVHPAVVLGLEQDNLFVAADGAWAEGRYVPAYVRRYPFVFIETADGEQLALGIDTASDRVVSAPDGGEGLVPLFDGDKPAPLTEGALRFSAALQASQVDTRAFCEALADQNLLIDQQAQGSFPDGRPFHVQGFRIVDAGLLAALPDEIVLDWNRKGWLALVHYHLASLACFRDLLARQGGVSEPLAELAEPAELVEA